MSGTSADVRIVPPSSTDWRAIIVGAVVTVGISTALTAFGSGIGLSTASSAPTWRDASPTLWIISGLYLVFVALCSFGCGGYLVGRIRSESGLEPEESAFRDGVHGVAVWGVAVLLAAIVALGGAAAIGRAASQSPNASPLGESTIASELDELFRGARPSPASIYITQRRAEVARILLKSSSHAGVPDEDRTYLAGLIGSEAALSAPDAVARVNDVIVKAAQALHRARQAAVMQAFLIGAALVLGAAVAWFAATEGGVERRQGLVPRWSLPTNALRR